MVTSSVIIARQPRQELPRQPFASSHPAPQPGQPIQFRLFPQPVNSPATACHLTPSATSAFSMRSAHFPSPRPTVCSPRVTRHSFTSSFERPPLLSLIPCFSYSSQTPSANSFVFIFFQKTPGGWGSREFSLGTPNTRLSPSASHRRCRLTVISSRHLQGRSRAKLFSVSQGHFMRRQRASRHLPPSDAAAARTRTMRPTLMLLYWCIYY